MSPIPTLAQEIACRKNPPNSPPLLASTWADQKHDVCLSLPGSDTREHSVIEHRPAAIEAWARAACVKRFNGAPVAVCIELAQGPIVSALLEHDFFVLFPVNPTTLARLSPRFHQPDRAKDDPSDAEVASRHPHPPS